MLDINLHAGRIRSTIKSNLKRNVEAIRTFFLSFLEFQLDLITFHSRQKALQVLGSIKIETHFFLFPKQTYNKKKYIPKSIKERFHRLEQLPAHLWQSKHERDNLKRKKKKSRGAQKWREREKKESEKR